jgi:hypothetical protein
VLLKPLGPVRREHLPAALLPSNSCPLCSGVPWLLGAPVKGGWCCVICSTLPWPAGGLLMDCCSGGVSQSHAATWDAALAAGSPLEAKRWPAVRGRQRWMVGQQPKDVLQRL